MSTSPRDPALTPGFQDPTSHLSHLFAWLALLPQGLCVVYVTLIWSTREVEIGLTFLGQLVCEALNWALKRHFKEQRPPLLRHLGKGYGMPSSHAQFLGYFAASVVLFVMLRHSPSARIRPADGRSGALHPTASQTREQDKLEGEAEALSDVYTLQLHHPQLTHSLLSLVAVASAVLMAVSRVYLSYHTPKQVIVGTAVGAGFAVFWFGLTEVARRIGLIGRFLDWNIVRMARIRDLLCEEDLIELGWQVSERKRRRRLEAAQSKGTKRS